MSQHPASVPVDIAGPAIGTARAEEALGDMAWWVTGGMSLLAWTGFALLLTAA
ncbi:MAG: hypothetical protein ACO1PB_13790 [Ramlibacter sp.]